MSQIGKLYEAYCKEHETAQITSEEMHLYDTLSGMVSHKDYVEIEALISTSYDQRDREHFFAGFRAATRIWTEALK